MPTLNTLLLSDGRPGHFNLSEGIVAALARKRPSVLHRVDVRRPFWIPARMLSFMVNNGMEPAKILQSVYGLSADRLPPADLVVSAGGNTVAANIAAARLLGVPNIFYGSLRRYRASDFSLVLSSYEVNDAHPNHLQTLKPSAFDPDTLKAAFKSGTDGPRMAGLILGGNAGTVTFKPDDWSKLLAFTRDVHQRFGTNWIIANGPRTPDAVSDQVALSVGQDSGIIKFIDFRQTGPGSLPQLLGQVDAVVCTADSSSMLSETVWARRAVLSVAPRKFLLPANEQSYRDWMAGQDWVRGAAIADLTPNLFVRLLLQITPMRANPLEALAQELETRLPDLFSSTT